MWKGRELTHDERTKITDRDILGYHRSRDREIINKEMPKIKYAFKVCIVPP